MKTENVAGRALARLAWYQDTKWLGEVVTPTVSGTTDWSKLSLAAEAPSDADSVMIVLELGYGTGTAWFDDVNISGQSELAPPVTYVFNDTDDWFPFEFPLDDTNLDSIDLTGLLDGPAPRPRHSV